MLTETITELTPELVEKLKEFCKANISRKDEDIYRAWRRLNTSDIQALGRAFGLPQQRIDYTCVIKNYDSPTV